MKITVFIGWFFVFACLYLQFEKKKICNISKYKSEKPRKT